ncbi:MAG: HU family DNA-binding protein [Acidobacteriota bacterium]|jgi:nucleoid DNA-binding protein
MTRLDIAKKVHSAHGGLTLPQAKALVDEVLDSIKDGLVEEGHVVLSGFGTFRVVRRKPRMGRDLAKGVPVPVPARNGLVFIPSRNLLKKEG